ncbi:hypothetical protein BPA30113_06560 [Burkholderia paludis]|uniref:Uncharacterized protein n=2 Tax=Burkholderiaceae TaxID=119060 RepID=A0A6J5EVU9_9BURK|nr:hypothetical protein LMG30113_05967 [Burkholderia paludis]VWC35619.1 hypothetical protein BPA30113_06560 [Burkholderia paludis]
MSVANLGVDENTSLFYEGSPSLYGHAVWPSPFVSITSHIGSMSGWNRQQSFSGLRDAPMLFREDSFDPVARIRRGRLYLRSPERNPATWRVQRHPAYATTVQGNVAHPNAHVNTDARGFLLTELVTFRSWQATGDLLRRRHDAVLILGYGDRAAAHPILDVERLVTGEELITVRTRPGLSGLPELLAGIIPERYVTIVVEQYEKVASAAFRDDAESVVDRCREAASAALNAARFAADGGDVADAKDLAVLGKFFESREQSIINYAAQTLARLHARVKSVEQIKRGIAPPTDADAETAITLLGLIYRELRWTR